MVVAPVTVFEDASVHPSHFLCEVQRGQGTPQFLIDQHRGITASAIHGAAHGPKVMAARSACTCVIEPPFDCERRFRCSIRRLGRAVWLAVDRLFDLIEELAEVAVAALLGRAQRESFVHSDAHREPSALRDQDGAAAYVAGVEGVDG